MIDIEVEDAAWSAALAHPEALAREAAQATFERSRGQAASGSLVILLTDDATVRDLNNRFRGKDSATNVLSFPAAANGAGHLGDLALAYGVCAGEARAQGKPLGHHLQHLVTHGVLHLLGYDHETDVQAEEMEGLERVILAGLGVADPYAAERGDDDER